MISFDVKSLLTNVPFEETVDIILDKTYDEKKLETKIPRNMKYLLYLCTKHVHFTYGGKIYIQIDGVAVGSPLGPLLANIFMISLEEAILPIREIQIHILYKMHKIRNSHMFG